MPKNGFTNALALTIVIAILLLGTVGLVGRGWPTPIQLALVPLPVATATPVPATATPAPTIAPTALPEGFQIVEKIVVDGSFDVRPSTSASYLVIAAGTVIKATTERKGERCRVVLMDGSSEDETMLPRVWVACSVIGK